jgi:hypothetical protein
MKRADAALDRIYERDTATNAFIIATAVEKYTDIFNELDPAPFKKRDINHDLRVFLEDCSFDIPLKYDVILQFNLAAEILDSKKEERILLGLRTYFRFVENQLKREISLSYQRGALYVSIAFFLLLTSYALRAAATSGIVFTTLVEGVTIGGWVFLWEAISTFAFKKRDVRNRKKHYERFFGAQIRFNYVSRVPIS